VVPSGGNAMTLTTPITTLFVDIGGVLLTNGWDHNIRSRAAEKFALDYEEMNERHHLTFDTYEEGKLSLEDYLNRVIFYRERSFSREAFKTFMYAQSQPFPEMIELIGGLKNQYGLEVAAVSNEGRELTVYRVQQFKLGTFIDFFVSSCFVHYRKPDEDIYRIALDIAQVNPENVIYIDDRAMFVEVAGGLGIRGIHHTTYETTRKALEGFGLALISGRGQPNGSTSPPSILKKIPKSG
jgi:putative hydrolase of the HAD superfamily